MFKSEAAKCVCLPCFVSIKSPTSLTEFIPVDSFDVNNKMLKRSKLVKLHLMSKVEIKTTNNTIQIHIYQAIYRNMRFI